MKSEIKREILSFHLKHLQISNISASIPIVNFPSKVGVPEGRIGDPTNRTDRGVKARDTGDILLYGEGVWGANLDLKIITLLVTLTP